MKNRIILMKADFRQNNIGRFIVVDELTKKVLTKQTQYTENSEEGLALNDFIVALKDDGFLGGENPILKTLVIPALANSHDELLYDIARTDDNGYPINVMSNEEKEAEVKSLLPYYSDGRVIGVVRDCTQGRIDINASRSQASITIGLFGTTDVAYSPFCAIVYKRGSVYLSDIVLENAATNYKILLSNNELSIKWDNQPAVSHINADVTPPAKNGYYMVNYSNNSWGGIIDGSTIGSSEAVGVENLKVQNGSNKFYLGSYAYDSTRWFNCSILAFGNAMTQEQMNKFKGLIDTLMIKLHAKIQ